MGIVLYIYVHMYMYIHTPMKVYVCRVVWAHKKHEYIYACLSVHTIWYTEKE